MCPLVPLLLLYHDASVAFDSSFSLFSALPFLDTYLHLLASALICSTTTLATATNDVMPHDNKSCNRNRQAYKATGGGRAALSCPATCTIKFAHVVCKYYLQNKHFHSKACSSKVINCR